MYKAIKPQIHEAEIDRDEKRNRKINNCSWDFSILLSSADRISRQKCMDIKTLNKTINHRTQLTYSTVDP